MNAKTKVTVSSLNEFIGALNNKTPQVIEINTSIVSPHSLTLPRGFGLCGQHGTEALLGFSEGGLGLVGDNSVTHLTLVAAPASRALYLVAGSEDYGTLELRHLNVTGQVGLIFRGGAEKAFIHADGVHVSACDSRAYNEQPQRYGVNVLQGAFTLYNFNASQTSVLHAKLSHISVGSKRAPVLGSGIFISGFGDGLGSVEIEKLTIGQVFSHGLLTAGTADFITAGVFISYGVHVKQIDNQAEVVTYGTNDMVLDNWGTVDQWLCDKPIVSYGPSGIGFVNFGVVGDFHAKDPIITYGQGARGFNQYAGTVKSIRFESISTYGNGSIGVQVSQPIGSLSVDKNLETFGGEGSSLVKGINMVLKATALSVKSGGEIDLIKIGGNIVTHGDGIPALVVEAGGSVKDLKVKDSISALGKAANSVELNSSQSGSVEGIKLISSSGQKLVYQSN